MFNKILISERALIQRMNRVLKKSNQQLKTARSKLVEDDYGKYFILDLTEQRVGPCHFDLELKARELGALKPYEELE